MNWLNDLDEEERRVARMNPDQRRRYRRESRIQVTGAALALAALVLIAWMV